jgi:hypothetical protein
MKMRLKRKNYGKFYALLFVTSLFISLLIVHPSYAQPVQGPNGHYYEIFDLRNDPKTWTEARDLAAGLNHMGLTGYLATITSGEENDFITGLYGTGCDAWIGGFQPPGSPEPNGNWGWITGEGFSYKSWDGDEPNNADDGENCLETRESGYWNDEACTETENPCAVIEYGEPILPVAEAVPTLNQWGFIIVGVLLAGSAVWFIRKRKPVS